MPQTASPSAEANHPTSLDPSDWPALRAQAHRMLEDILDYTQGIQRRPLWQPIPPDVRQRFRATLPTQPTSLNDVHAEFMQHILPYGPGNAHPGFMGWAQGGGTPAGMLAEMLAAGLNANLGGRDHIPIEVENQLTGWMRDLFGFPAAATGLCVSGTSTANLIAVKIARDQIPSEGIQREGGTSSTLRCYASTAVHGCIAKALDIAGLGTHALHAIPTNARGQIDLAQLLQAIQTDRAAALTPFLVVASAGTIDTGAIDDLTALAEICRQQNIWFHVDGAFGALAMLAPDLAPRLAGIERADSIAFDFHKWGQVPYDAGFLLVRDGRLQQQSFSSITTSAPYLARETRGMAAGQTWPCDLGIELSRGFRALKVWFTFKTYGAAAIGALIAETCALARYLEQRIRDTPELELLAPVELNIVCFGYRSSRADELNRMIVIDLQECGRVAPSTTILQGRVALRAAFFNHRTTRSEVDTLIDHTLIIGRALESAFLKQPIAGNTPAENARAMVTLALDALDRRLLYDPASTGLLFQRACLLEATGQADQASQAYRDLLDRDPDHLGALNNLANQLVAAGRRIDARPFLVRAVAAHPRDTASRANLGNVLMQHGEPAAAAQHFQAALQIDPNFRPAHAGLSFALLELGDAATATLHRHKAFADRSVVITAYRGNRPPIVVLEIVSTIGGNVRTDPFLSDRVFQRILVAAEFYTPGTPLPPHHLVFNAVGEADTAGPALTGAQAVVAATTQPVVNHPAAVLATGRSEIARRLAAIPGVRTAHTVDVSRHQLQAPDAAQWLAANGFHLPLLIRTPGFHGGEHFARVDALDQLPATLQTLPGDDLIVIQYLDARGPDGNSRKYRVMMVDGQLYPLHVAISPNWKIHYYSADMADRPDHRAEDAAFLEDMERVLGPQVITALQNIQTTLGLDYGGIDFGLNQQGEVLIFEANATMAIVKPDPDPRWDYRRKPTEAIYIAVWKMLEQRALRSLSDGQPAPPAAAPHNAPALELAAAS